MKPKNNLIQILSPYGKWQHSKGTQLVNKESALNLAKNFPSYLWQKFFKKIPIYVGHPDEFEKESKLKSQIVGYVEKIIPLDDGIAVLCNYDDAHYRKILDKKLEFMSARWKTTLLEDGNFMPIELISVGLTNEPNIENSGKILSIENLIKQDESAAKNLREKEVLKEEIQQSILKTKNSMKSIDKIKSIQESLTESISKKLLSSALNNGFITADECHSWAQLFKEKFGETKKKLIQRSTPTQELNVRELVALTKQKMKEEKLSWDSAFSKIKKEKSLTQSQVAMQ